jgi:outer membrane protein
MKNKIVKLSIVIALLFFTLKAEAQQLTRFAVADLPRVYLAFFRESRAVREYEEQSARVQAEVDRMTREIQELRSRRLSAETSGDRTQALRLENEINRNSEFLNEFFRVKTAELENIRNNLTRSDTFLRQVNDEIRIIAESEGYSMVLNLKENTGVLWFSPTVDITDKLIQNLRARANR